MSSQTRFNEKSSVLSRFLDEAPYLSRCSWNKTAAVIRPREYAVEYPYMQVNRKNMVSWLVFDLDHANPFIWQDKNLPEPNLIVTNRANGHSHLFYAIKPVCTSENARSKPINYMKAIYKAFAQVLDADENYSGPVAKTPFHPWWQTAELHSYEYELGELADSCELEINFRKKNIEQFTNLESRHCLLFDTLREYAYSIVQYEKKNGSYLSFEKRLNKYAYQNNNFKKKGFSENLKQSQVKATIKSVCRWTWDKYVGSDRCNTGVMQLNKDLSISDRQKLSAARTHNIKLNKTILKIKNAIQVLKVRKVKLTQVNIAHQAQLSRQTVSKYQELINEANSRFSAISLPDLYCVKNKKNVNFATHQITAPFIVPQISLVAILNNSLNLFINRYVLKPPDK